MISANTYEEVYEVLGYMDKITVMKIPEEIILKIREKRNPNFITKIQKENIFDENNISKEAVDLLCWLDYTYWRNDNERSKINDIIKEKNEFEEKLKRDKYSPDDIFKNKKNNEIVSEETKPEENSMVEYTEKNFLQKIFDKIKHLFKKD